MLTAQALYVAITPGAGVPIGDIAPRYSITSSARARSVAE
jgi:hypothetical protein